MRYVSLVLAAVLAAACSESPTAPSAVSNSISPDQSGGASPRAQSGRDNPVQPGTQCPSGPVLDFKVNPAGHAFTVDVLGRVVTDDTSVTYIMYTKRQNNLRPGGYEEEFLTVVEVLNASYQDSRFVAGTYLSRISPVCNRVPTGAWVDTEWGINGPAPEQAATPAPVVPVVPVVPVNPVGPVIPVVPVVPVTPVEPVVPVIPVIPVVPTNPVVPTPTPQIPGQNPVSECGTWNWADDTMTVAVFNPCPPE